MASWGIGDLVMFNYSLGTDVHDQNPTVLVLHDDWLCHTPKDPVAVRVAAENKGKRCMHGLNWNNLDKADQTYLRAVMNPALELKLTTKDPSFASVMDQVNRLSNLNIQSPQDFYVRLIRPFIKPKGWEPYRRYRTDKIRGAFQVESAQLLSGAQRDTLYQKAYRQLRVRRGPVF